MPLNLNLPQHTSRNQPTFQHINQHTLTMPELRYNAFVPQLLLQMQNLLTSNASNLPSSCDEELADEADEPPDVRSPSYPIHPGGEFAKYSVCHPAPSESLLTRALLTTPELVPVDRLYRGLPKRGMSTDSTWSNISSASTADLTSDGGMTSPSRCNTPSPPPPLFFAGFPSLLQGKKDQMESRKVEVVGDKDDVVEGQGRRRCITFACSNKLTAQKPMFEGQPAVRPAPTETDSSDAAPKRSCALKFVCAQREDVEKKTSLRSPPPRSTYGLKRHASAVTQFTQAIIKPNMTAPTPISNRCSDFPDQKFYEFASSVDDRSDSWTNQPIDKSRLLKVDDLLKKELDIRKLSQEAEEEALEEEEAEQDLEDADLDEEDGDEDEDDQELDGDDYSEEDDHDALSGNESDNEEGFASDSDDDDDRFFNYGPGPIRMSTRLDRPLCCRTASESSIESMMKPRITPPLERRPRTPELPDSTDFVCGTLDEDKALEAAYVSCMEERKRSKHIVTPQDIDPSFPTSDPEASDDEIHSKSHESEAGFQFKTNWSGSSVEGNRRRGRGNDKILMKRKTISPAPKARVHSPAPIRRTTLAHSPALVRRTQSPPPKHRPTMNFQSQPGIYRTKSLPRIPGFLHRNGKTGRMTSAGTSPTTSATSPVTRRRGAIDIVKGLEKKRERRQRLCKGRDGDCRAGQGVEKMRELGLEICGKGKGRTQAQWVLSA